MKKKVIIIGGGMAGMCAGAYLQMNGYDSEIFEMNNVPGGVCTSWKKGDYTIDLCIHWLVGSGSGSSIHDRWSELIDLGEIQFVNHEEFYRAEDQNGNYISVYGNIDKLESELLQKAPEDEKEIHHFIHALRHLAQFNIPTDKAAGLYNIWDRLKFFAGMVPFLPTFGRYMGMTCREYSKHFQNPLLRKVMCNLPGPDMGIIFGMFALSWFHNQTAGYPIGGSLNFANKIFDTYSRLGGKMHFESRVSKVLVAHNAATGIELDNGEQFQADIVVSAADGYATIFEMLEGKYVDAPLLKFYHTARRFPSLVFVSLGVKKDMSAVAHLLLLPQEHALQLDPDTRLDDIIIHNHCYDPSLAPAGSTLLTVMLETYNYQYWDNLYREDRLGYEAEKTRIADAIIDMLDKRFGDIRANVEMTDVATPVTFRSFSGNWNGSYEGWRLTPETGLKRLPQTLPGLKNFYMCGQWVAIGGGLPSVMLSGRDAAQLICDADGTQFEAHAATTGQPETVVAE